MWHLVFLKTYRIIIHLKKIRSFFKTKQADIRSWVPFFTVHIYIYFPIVLTSFLSVNPFPLNILVIVSSSLYMFLVHYCSAVFCSLFYHSDNPFLMFSIRSRFFFFLSFRFQSLSEWVLSTSTELWSFSLLLCLTLQVSKQSSIL